MRLRSARRSRPRRASCEHDRVEEPTGNLVSVRPAELADADAIAPLLSELGYATHAEQVRDRVARLTSRRDGGVLVAELAGAIAGVVGYQVIDLLERASPQCRITVLITRSEHRRRGVATALLRAVETAARAHGCFRLEVTTRPKRVEALGFYAASGFCERPRRLVKALAAP